jgi:hypothetical protein
MAECACTSAVSTEIDTLDSVDAGWWALGKLVAYSLQDRAFVHLDADVFLWKPLPTRLISAPVFAQCPERHGLGDSWREEAFERHGASLPVEWLWVSSRIIAGGRCCDNADGAKAERRRAKEVRRRS